MAGHTRRALTEDTLAGRTQIKPARLTGPGLSAPTLPGPQPSITNKISNALGDFATETLKSMTSAQNQRDLMDGAIAATQGKALEALETEGANKFALDGHRILTAQSINSQLKAAQIQLIEDSAYSLGPDDYRAQLSTQLTRLTEGQDEFTARLIMENSVEMLPDLVGRQTTAHANFQEQTTFDAVVQAMGAQSDDEIGQASLLGMAAGDGTAAGLSQARRDQAIMEGIVLALVNGNPRPYHLMKSNGVLNDFSTHQLNRINDAVTQHQNRLRNTFNAERIAQHAEVDARVSSGNDPYATPLSVMEEHVGIDAQHEINMTNLEARARFKQAIDPVNTGRMTRWLVAEAARESGDLPAFAKATLPLVLGAESKPSDPDDVQGPLVTKGANKGFHAQGRMQVMPPTLLDPGFNIRPSNGSTEDNLRVGEEYWAVMIQGSAHPSGLLKYPPMDVEAAAIAYNAGFVNASAWELAGRDYSVLPDRAQTEPYAKGIKKKYDDQRAPLVGSKFNIALNNLTTTKKVVAAEKYGVASQLMAAEDQRWNKGEIDQSTWRANRRSIMSEYEIIMNKAIADSEISTIKAKIKAADAIADDRTMRSIAGALLGPQIEFDRVMNDPSSSQQDMIDAVTLYRTTADDVFLENGIMHTDDANVTVIDQNVDTWRKQIRIHEKFAEEQAQIQFALDNGGVEQLSETLKQRLLKQRREETMREVKNVLAASGENGEEAIEAASEVLNEDLFYSWKQGQFVDPQSTTAESHILNNGVIVTTTDPRTGKQVKTVSDNAVGTLRRYRAFKGIAPEISDQFLDGPALLMAEMAWELAGTDATDGELKDALFQIVDREALTKTTNASLDAFAIEANTMAEIDKVILAMTRRTDVSLLQALGASFIPGRTKDVFASDAISRLSSERQELKTEENIGKIHDAISRELRAMKRLNPNADARLLVPLAMERVKSQSAFIGGSFVTTNVNIMQEMFGDQAGIYDKVNIVQDVALAWINSPEIQKEHPEFSSTTWTDFMTRGDQNLFANIADLFGFDSDINKGISLDDAVEAQIRGSRPIIAITDVDGKIILQAMNFQGIFESPGILLPLREAADYYKTVNPIIVNRTPSLATRVHGALETMLNRGVSFSRSTGN